MKQKTPFIFLLLLFSLLSAQPDSSSLRTINIQDSCFSGLKISPERSFYTWNYQVGDSVYTRNKVVDLMLSNKSTHGIMYTSKSFTIVSVLLLCGGLIGGNIGLKVNNPVLAGTSIGISSSGIGLFIGSVALSTKAIKTYNRSLCN